MTLDDIKKRLRFVVSDSTDFNQFFQACIDYASSLAERPLTPQERRLLSNELVDACYTEFERRKQLPVQTIQTEKSYVPMEMRIKYDESGRAMQCECCRFPATRTQFDTSNSTTHYFCDWHTLKCAKKISREKILEMTHKKDLKDRPYLDWSEEHKLNAGIFCQTCFDKTGELVEIVRGTCKCPRCGEKGG